MKQQTLSQAATHQKLMRYCAYQDRCSHDVVTKMKLWYMDETAIEEALGFLKNEGFIDDLRFAKSFVRGKFRSNKWGRAKIREGLYAKRINRNLIEEGLLELNDENYQEQLFTILEKKNRLLKEEDPYKRKQKLAVFAQSKGYELDLIWETLKSLDLNNL